MQSWCDILFEARRCRWTRCAFIWSLGSLPPAPTSYEVTAMFVINHGWPPLAGSATLQQEPREEGSCGYLPRDGHGKLRFGPLLEETSSKVSSTRHHSRSGNRSGCLMTKTRRHSRREVRQPSGPGRRQDMCIGEAPICISSPAVEEWWVREIRPRPSYRNVLQKPIGQNRHGYVLFVHEFTCRARFSEPARRLDSGCCMVKTR